jgi:hypothetical protein
MFCPNCGSGTVRGKAAAAARAERHSTLQALDPQPTSAGRFFERLAERQPAILVLEDMW